MNAMRGWEWLIVLGVVVFLTVVIGVVVGLVVWAVRRGNRPQGPAQPGQPPTTWSGPDGA